RGRDVPGQDRRDRAGQGALYQPAASLHRSAPVRGADPRPYDEAQADPARRRRAEPDQPALRLPLPHPVLASRAVVLGERADTQRNLSRSLGRLPGPHRRLDPLSAAEGTGVRWALVRPARQPCYRSSSCSAIPVTVPTQGSQGPTAHPPPLLTLPAEPACVPRAPRATGAGWAH